MIMVLQMVSAKTSWHALREERKSQTTRGQSNLLLEKGKVNLIRIKNDSSALDKHSNTL
jgi:hypothetical protein